MSSQEIQRRHFMRWVALSSLAIGVNPLGVAYSQTRAGGTKPVPDIKNIRQLEELSRSMMGEDAQLYLNGGADDLRTITANESAYARYQIRARRLVDVRSISTSIELFGTTLGSPILLCPVGFQRFMHEDGEVATAKAAVNKGHQMIVSSVSNFSIQEIADRSGANLWFQLYPSTDRSITKKLLEQAESAGCEVCALTVDTPVVGNRERSGTTLLKLIQAGELEMGNFRGLLKPGISFTDPSMTWDMISWLRNNTDMKIVLKGIVTHEDARLSVEHGVDGVIVSNHGGRQLESDRATIDCLSEVVDAVGGAFPVLIDGGIRRGTDIFKALAIGASAVCIGRPYCWGLGAMGQQGVELALEILQSELIRDMQLAGTNDIQAITSDFITTS